ncbi:MAG: PleD family two-component system response regulator [Mesorhizobium sp.]|uniref:PleD family two-component system response regulator n=1 Tax=unclassified Mesorhizobium TaxID=325217 RepID=UPI000FE54806|nr:MULTISPECIES: PleD family two-component system response regulator [unclassified Mesorhizobium]RWI20388.1 MAG: PleD family two-component system response regulator [Mesorhizobium sp.]RWK47728.1 MAG: PleD family two-component system response regulator [Mesorhizobium sp.]RWK95588.1 MAG: PleD family two-component system response regulator [Mesorhizobium sp.]TIP56513.1 MAG: PleD family two-component system response regulator [Mesorhizobium sp.]TIQ17111.1 MAG: PleD family two-component system resp
MTARILVVDDIPANVRLLEVRLLAEYFEVLTATNGLDAIETCENGKVDVVLLDVMMPDMDGFEVCRRLKSDPATSHIPVVMITALDQVSDRVRGLEAGADDFLTKPVKDLQLMTRVKSLVRLKTLTDELRLRASTTRNIGIEELLSRNFASADTMPKVLLIDERKSSFERVQKMLRGSADLDIATDPHAGFFQAAETPYECVMISTGFADFDPLRLCSQLRSLDRTRFVPIILLAEQGEEGRIVRGLELGINDYLMRPIDQQELTARLRTQVRRKRYNDQLRASVTQTIEMAVTDALTGLHNRRYLDSHLQTLFDRAVARRRPLSVMITDLDRFKAVNDAHGHDGGDEVLREFARRLRKNVRGIDLACRFGGEEFVVVMPDTDGAVAEKVAERIRAEIAQMPFAVGQDGKTIEVTVSVGVSAVLKGVDSVSGLMKRADLALYEAKSAGRNRVVAKAA